MHLADGNVNVERSVLPGGVAGVDATVHRMAKMAMGKWGAKSAKIRALALNAVRAQKVPDKDYYGEILAIHEWVKKNIRYFRDPIGQETLSYPEETAFNSKGGDCDDLTILEMAMLGAVGIRSYPVVIGVEPGKFSHVYLHAIVPPGNHRNAGMIVPLDPIMKNWPAGKEADAKRVKEKKTYPHVADLAATTVNGHPMSDLGAYATGPSYLDTEHSHAAELLVPDRIDVRRDNTVANSTQVVQPLEGMDAMMAGIGSNDDYDGNPNARDFYIQGDPPMGVLMNSDPAKAKNLYALGPLYDRAGQASIDRAKREGRPVPLRQAQGIPSIVGTKRYEVPTVQAALRAKRGLMPHNPALLRGQTIVNLSPKKNRPVMRVVNQPLSGDDLELGALEKRVAQIRANKRRKPGVRAAAVTAQIPRAWMPPPTGGYYARPSQGQMRMMSGLDGIMDTVKSPFVYIPAAALVAIVAWKLLGRKRR